MRINRSHVVALALSAMTVAALGIGAAAQQKPATKGAAPTAVTVYKTPT